MPVSPRRPIPGELAGPLAAKSKGGRETPASTKTPAEAPAAVHGGDIPAGGGAPMCAAGRRGPAASPTASSAASPATNPVARPAGVSPTAAEAAAAGERKAAGGTAVAAPGPDGAAAPRFAGRQSAALLGNVADAADELDDC
eukprot:TRINITY_DN18196_c0_g1_i3.p4 TRINITY_DN18196_c0_g1~~TRINITY_DN18196_c0_g1_i3.p4  ORF type:complete len:166 (+),score=20.96 TRINITY_DN18196_c0_g1_i3:75-500(+)